MHTCNLPEKIIKDNRIHRNPKAIIHEIYCPRRDFHYNTFLMKNTLPPIGMVLIFAGCGQERLYNPLASAAQQSYLLNESSFTQVTAGMKQEQVHHIMGDSIVIGYTYQNPQSPSSTAVDSKPLTIVNPYKSEDIKTKDGVYTVEYYVPL